MTIIERTFNTAVAVLPVIHVESAVQAAEESVLALATGAHGVFLSSTTVTPTSRWKRSTRRTQRCTQRDTISPGSA